MGIADKKYSNVDKKTAEILVEAKLLLEEEGYEVSKPREKSIARELMNAAYANAFKTMSKDPDLTVKSGSLDIVLNALPYATFINSWAIDFSLGLEASCPSSSNNNLASLSISAVPLSTFENVLSVVSMISYSKTEIMDQETKQHSPSQAYQILHQQNHQ